MSSHKWLLPLTETHIQVNHQGFKENFQWGSQYQKTSAGETQKDLLRQYIYIIIYIYVCIWLCHNTSWSELHTQISTCQIRLDSGRRIHMLHLHHHIGFVQLCADVFVFPFEAPNSSFFFNCGCFCQPGHVGKLPHVLLWNPNLGWVL